MSEQEQQMAKFLLAKCVEMSEECERGVIGVRTIADTNVVIGGFMLVDPNCVHFSQMIGETSRGPLFFDQVLN